MEPENRQAARAALDWGSFNLFLLLLGGLVLCGWILWPFLPALTGAIVLAVVTRTPVLWLLRRVGRPGLAAAFALVVIVALIVTPILFVAYSVGQHVLDVSRALQTGAPEHEISRFFDQHPEIAALLQRLAESYDPGQAFDRALAAAAGRLAVFLGHSLTAFLQIVVMLFVLFFLYRDAGEALRLARVLLPLRSHEAEYLLERSTRAIRALVLGRFAVAAIQGTIAGLTFLALGIAGSELLGFLTMLLALVPAVGAYVVWLPVAIYLLFAHHWIQAIILFAVGALIISTLDNILYPVLVGSRLRLHTVPIFLAMIGGIWFFGVTGLLLGPILFNLTASLLDIWRCRARGEPLPLA